MNNPFNQLSDMCKNLDVIGKGLDDVLEKQKAIVIAVKKIIDETKNPSSVLYKKIERHEGNIQRVKKMRIESLNLKNSLGE